MPGSESRPLIPRGIGPAIARRVIVIGAATFLVYALGHLFYYWFFFLDRLARMLLYV